MPGSHGGSRPAPRQRVVAYDHPRPELRQQVLSKHDVPRVPGEHHEDVHDPGVELLAARGSNDFARIPIDGQAVEGESSFQ